MSEAPDIEPGVEIGRYRIVRRIGGGAAGTVFEAFDHRLERPVAIKIADVPAAVADQDEFAKRFSREARIAASLSHPNLCPVYDFGTHEGRPFIVMALLPGATLADLVARHAPLAADRILVLLRPIAEALAEMHRSGLVHRDIKPQNILLDARLEPLLTDFGLARPELFIGGGEAPAAGRRVAASPAYLAPEQLQAGQRVGPAADMHAFGVVMYELMTGRLPFRGTDDEVVQQITNDPPPRPSQIAAGVSRDLEQLCLHLLRKPPAERPSAAETARRMRAIAERGSFNIIPHDESESLALQPAAAPASPAPSAGLAPPPAPAPPPRPSRAARPSSHGSRFGEWPSILGLLLMLVVLISLGYALTTQRPWEWLTSLQPEKGEVDSVPQVEPGTRSPDAGPSVGPSRAAAPPAASDAPADAADGMQVAEQIDPELIAAPGYLFARGDEIAVAAAALPAAPQGRAAAWWSGDDPRQLESLDAGSLVPAREGANIVGVVISASGETVAVLGEAWYARIAATGGSPVTNRVSGWLTVERAATASTGDFALLQKTALENQKRISVWKVADGANPTERMAIYCDASTTALTLAPDGRGLAFGDTSGRVSMQSVARAGEVLAELRVPGPVSGLAFSTGNLQLAIAHEAGESASAGIVLFTYASGEWSETRRIASGGPAAHSLHWSPDAARLCGVTPDGFASVWDLEGGEPPRRIANVAGSAIAWVDADTLIAGHSDGRVRRWRALGDLSSDHLP